MNAQQTLLAEVEQFLACSGMAAGTFGHETVNDGKFVARLRGGGSVTLDTAARVRRYIEENSRAKTFRSRRSKSAA